MFISVISPWIQYSNVEPWNRTRLPGGLLDQVEFQGFAAPRFKAVPVSAVTFVTRATLSS